MTVATMCGLGAILFCGAAGAATLAGCPMLPADNIWNTPVDALPLHPSSADYVATVGSSTKLHFDFGGPYGIPYVTVPGTQPKVAVRFRYASESDPGPYPIPPDAPVEGGGDRHVLVLDRDNCVLYETFASVRQPDGSWRADSGAIFDLRSNLLRRETATSADAAGLPILPGLLRYDEVAAGEITHAVRFTAPQTQQAYLWPARHYASDSTDPALPPMGLRMRLNAGFDISGFSPQMQVILRGLKKYGMMLADNGSAWYITGAQDSRWPDILFDEMRRVPGSAFEAVDVASLQIAPDSGAARSPNEAPEAQVPALPVGGLVLFALALLGLGARVLDGNGRAPKNAGRRGKQEMQCRTPSSFPHR